MYTITLFQVKKEEEITNTPISVKNSSKKRGKAPRFSTPKNPSLLPRNIGQPPGKDENKDIQPIDKRLLKLPEAMYREIPDYKVTVVFKVFKVVL